MTAARPLAPVPDQAAPRRTRWTDAELMTAQFPEPRWAVPGLLCEGINLLAGAPKLGKSWMSLGLGAAIANRDPALNSIDVERGPVRYCALEDTGRRLQRRRRQMLAAGGRAAPLLTLETACPVMTAGGDAVLIEWLEDNPHARLIIIDTFEKMRGADPNAASSYAADYAAATRFKKIADHYGVPILLIHHVRKQGAEDFQSLVSGTNGLTGAMDAILVLERGRGQADGGSARHRPRRRRSRLRHELRRAFRSKLDGPAADYEMADTRADIVRLLREHGGMKPARIAEALQLNANTVRKTCTRMATDGQLKAVPGGTYTVPTASDTDDTPPLSHLSLSHSTPSDQQEQE